MSSIIATPRLGNPDRSGPDEHAAVLKLSLRLFLNYQGFPQT